MSSIKSKPLKANQTCNCFISLLPAEIIEIILQFYTNHFTGIIKFGAINRQFKDIADHTRLWLTCNLSFCCSPSYFRQITGLVGPPKAAVAQAYFEITYFSLDGFYQPDIHYTLVKVPADCYYFAFLRPYAFEALSTPLNPLLSSQTADFPNHPIPTVSITKIHEQIKLCRQATIVTYIKIYKLWSSYVYWMSRINYWNKLTQDFMNQYYWKATLVFSIILPILSCSFLYNIENNPTSLTVLNHLGFMCFELFLVMYLIVIIETLFHTFVDRFVHHPINGDLIKLLDFKEYFSSSDYRPFRGFLFVMLMVIASVILLQCKLSSNSTSFRFIYVAIPMVLLTAVLTIGSCIVKSNDVANCERFTLLITLNTIFWSLGLTVLLLCLYNDDRNHYGIPDLSVVIIPFYLFEFIFCLATIFSFMHAWATIREHFGYAFRNFVNYEGVRDYLMNRKALWLGRMIRTLIFTFMAALLIALNVLIINDQFTLALGLIGTIVWIACFTLLIHIIYIELSSPDIEIR